MMHDDERELVDREINIRDRRIKELTEDLETCRSVSRRYTEIAMQQAKELERLKGHLRTYFIRQFCIATNCAVESHHHEVKEAKKYLDYFIKSR